MNYELIVCRSGHAAVSAVLLITANVPLGRVTQVLSHKNQWIVLNCNWLKQKQIWELTYFAVTGYF